MTAGLTDSEQVYVYKRDRLTRIWPMVGGALLLMLLGGSIWLWLTTPNFINPWATIEALESGTLPPNIINIMATMLPVIVLACVVLLITLLLLPFAAFSNERKLIRMIRKLSSTEE